MEEIATLFMAFLFAVGNFLPNNSFLHSYYCLTINFLFPRWKPSLMLSIRLTAGGNHRNAAGDYKNTSGDFENTGGGERKEEGKKDYSSDF